LSPGCKATGDLAQGLTLLNSKLGPSLNTTIAGYGLQRIPAVPIHREQGQETPDLGLCPIPAGSRQRLTLDLLFSKIF
jgi:hypothetical protein